MKALLEVQKLTKKFGGLTAIQDLNFYVKPGEILGLIGPNGAGKTTVFNLISGILKPTGGRVFYKGKDITGMRTHKLAAIGIVRTFQHTNLFNELTVLECMIVSHHIHFTANLWGEIINSKQSRSDKKMVREKSLKILNDLRLIQLRSELSKNLSHGHQRILGIALSLAADPELLMLDEPLTGMNPQEVTAMLDIIKQVCREKMTIIVVEHNMRAIMGLSDRILVINFGKKIAEGSASDIKQDEEVIRAYLGSEE